MTRTCVFHVSGNQFPSLSVDHHTRRIWAELAKGFDEYHVLARAEDMRFNHSVDGNVHLHLIPAFGKRMWVFFFLSWLLPFYVLRYKPTHLLAQCPVVGGLAATACARVFGIPLFVELHGAHYFSVVRKGWLGYCEFNIYRIFTKITFATASTIRSLSDDMSNRLRLTYGQGPFSKTVNIPTRVDLTVFSTLKTTFQVGSTLRLISVGSFIPGKNHISLIKDLHSSNIAFQLTLVGSGPLEQEYRKVASELGIGEHVIIPGVIGHQELSVLLPSQDVYVHYSLSEGLSRAILEAMAVGLPVVATRVGFIEGVLANSENCLLLDAPWQTNLGQALRRLSDSEILRQSLGRSARSTIEERFESNLVFEKYRRAILRAGTGAERDKRQCV